MITSEQLKTCTDGQKNVRTSRLELCRKSMVVWSGEGSIKSRQTSSWKQSLGAAGEKELGGIKVQLHARWRQFPIKHEGAADDTSSSQSVKNSNSYSAIHKTGGPANLHLPISIVLRRQGIGV